MLCYVMFCLCWSLLTHQLRTSQKREPGQEIMWIVTSEHVILCSKTSVFEPKHMTVFESPKVKKHVL